MKGKVVLITGATGGIGSAVAQQLARAEAQLVLTGRNSEVLEQLSAQCHALGSPEVLPITAEITDRLQVEQLFETAYRSLGQVDVVINGAGLGILKPITQLSEAEFDRMLSVNLKGTYLVCQQAIHYWTLHKTPGHVFNIPGILGQHPMATAGGYCASKYAVSGLTKAMALDCKRLPIKFTLLYLGGVNTPFWEQAGMKVQRDKLLQPQQVAEAIYFALQVPAPGIPTEIVIQPESHVFL